MSDIDEVTPNPLLHVQAVTDRPFGEDPHTALFFEDGGPLTGTRVLEVFAHRSQIHEGVLLVQLDTNTDTGRLRIQLNDGTSPVWDGDPEEHNGLWCAECGTGEATTYVVTFVDGSRTEVCRPCDDKVRGAGAYTDLVEAMAYCEAPYEEQEEEDPASRLKQAAEEFLVAIGRPRK